MLATMVVGNCLKSMKMQQKPYDPHYEMPESLKLKSFCTYSQLWEMKLASVTKSMFLLQVFTFRFLLGTTIRHEIIAPV